MTDEPKPQPCPVCHTSARVAKDWANKGAHWWFCYCRNCQTQGPNAMARESAIRAWNRLRYVEET
jgi:hypothetical protein